MKSPDMRFAGMKLCDESQIVLKLRLICQALQCVVFCQDRLTFGAWEMAISLYDRLHSPLNGKNCHFLPSNRVLLLFIPARQPKIYRCNYEG
jgi:hypothetical protein